MRDSHSSRFTGWHITAILIVFFAVVIAVNMLMATMAVRSFGGTVVDNSYIASQKFNDWLKQAQVQERLGWKDSVMLADGRKIHFTLADAEGAPISGVQLKAVAQHPLGQVPDTTVMFHERRRGLYISEQSLPSGRWRLRFAVRHGSGEQHLLREVN